MKNHVLAEKTSFTPKKDYASKRYHEFFPEAPGKLRFFSAPGRTELGGNHTDHNNGKVLAAAIQLEALAAVEPVSGSVVRFYSDGWNATFAVNLNLLTPQSEEYGQTAALLRGVTAGFVARGLKIGAFNAFITSSVLPGSGLSSSAAIEVLFGVILNGLFNEGQIPPATLARIGQFAENRFFGKPCGLMDQMASAVGGVIAIDFKDDTAPVVRPCNIDLASAGLELTIVNTGGSHADLTADYAAIRSEMELIAAHFGATVLREVPESAFFTALPELYNMLPHRAILRAMHFFQENTRVDAMVNALSNNDIDSYLSLVNQSGRSSVELLQNAWAPAHPEEQGVLFGLALTRRALGSGSAYRLHGGGFAGTIQAYVPTTLAASYKSLMESVFGSGCVYQLRIRTGNAGELP